MHCIRQGCNGCLTVNQVVCQCIAPTPSEAIKVEVCLPFVTAHHDVIAATHGFAEAGFLMPTFFVVVEAWAALRPMGAVAPTVAAVFPELQAFSAVHVTMRASG